MKSVVRWLRGVRRFWKSFARGWVEWEFWISFIGVGLGFSVRFVGGMFRSSSLPKIDRDVLFIVWNLEVEGMLKILNFFGSIRCRGFGSWVLERELFLPLEGFWLSIVGKA